MKVIVTAVLLPIIATACIHRVPPPQKPTPLCVLVQQSSSYEGTVIETTGTLTSGPEVAFLSSADCDTPESRIYVDPLGGTVWSGSPSVMRRLSKLLRSGRAQVVVTGRFHGPKEVDAPGVNSSFDDLYRQAHSRWGPGGGFRFALVDPEFLSARPVDD